MKEVKTMIELDKIYNADCYEKIKEIPDKSIDCIYTDIPYLYQTGGTSKTEMGSRRKKLNNELHNFNLKLQHSDKSKYNSIRIDKYQAQKRLDIVSMDTGIDYAILDDFCRVMKKTNIFIWCSKSQILDLLKYFVEKKSCYFELLVWAKTNAMPTNQCFLSDLEYCLYFREPGLKINNAYELKSKWYESGSNKKDKAKWLHPTIKPLKFVTNHILLATNPGDIVLDCFAGSGTTAVACKNTGRHFILIEKNKDFYKIANDRVNNQVDCQGQYSMFAM